jgi:hypothetical protein
MVGTGVATTALLLVAAIACGAVVARLTVTGDTAIAGPTVGLTARLTVRGTSRVAAGATVGPTATGAADSARFGTMGTTVAGRLGESATGGTSGRFTGGGAFHIVGLGSTERDSVAGICGPESGGYGCTTASCSYPAGAAISFGLGGVARVVDGWGRTADWVTATARCRVTGFAVTGGACNDAAIPRDASAPEAARCTVDGNVAGGAPTSGRTTEAAGARRTGRGGLDAVAKPATVPAGSVSATLWPSGARNRGSRHAASAPAKSSAALTIGGRPTTGWIGSTSCHGCGAARQIGSSASARRRARNGHTRLTRPR